MFGYKLNTEKDLLPTVFDDSWAPPSPAGNRGLVCLMRGSRLVALTAGWSWSLDQ